MGLTHCPCPVLSPPWVYRPAGSASHRSQCSEASPVQSDQPSPHWSGPGEIGLNKLIWTLKEIILQIVLFYLMGPDQSSNPQDESWSQHPQCQGKWSKIFVHHDFLETYDKRRDNEKCISITMETILKLFKWSPKRGVSTPLIFQADHVTNMCTHGVMALYTWGNVTWYLLMASVLPASRQTKVLSLAVVWITPPPRLP